MKFVALFKKIVGLKGRNETPATNGPTLTSDELKIFDAVKKTREWREGATNPLCDNINCSTGCNMRFRMIIKEALAENADDKNYLQALEPHLREKVRLFCHNHRNLLKDIELDRLLIFCAALDERIPEEAQLKRKMEEEREREHKQRKEAWRKEVEEKRAVKKRKRQLRHKQRLQLKRERDHYYWIAYWAAKHAIKDEKK